MSYDKPKVTIDLDEYNDLKKPAASVDDIKELYGNALFDQIQRGYLNAARGNVSISALVMNYHTTWEQFKNMIANS